MASWGLCATVKAPLEAVECFAAHHLEAGAAWIRLYFDDPEDPAAAALAGERRIEVVRCTTRHWRRAGKGRPKKIRVRQTINCREAYAAAPVEWMAHVDVDEFIHCEGEVGAALDAVPADQVLVKMLPFEALFDPEGDGRPLTSRHFRTAPRGGDADLVLAEVYGRHAEALNGGMLSHHVGKSLFRTGVADFVPDLHFGTLKGGHLGKIRFAQDLVLLHYHASDPEHWVASVRFRAEQGGYSHDPARKAFFLAASEAELFEFYMAVQVWSPALAARLDAHGLLLEQDLGLDAKRARVFTPPAPRPS